MKLKVWKLGGKISGNNHFIQAEGITLPQGFGVAEECVVGVMVNVHGFDVLEATTLLVSDPRWADATPSPGYDIPIVMGYAGGEEKAKEMIEDLIQEWEEATKKKVKFTTNINEELLKKVKMTAIKEGRNVNEIIEEQLEKYLEEGNNMKKIIIKCLEILREEQLLNSIGEKLAEEPERFPETIENMADYFENQSREYVLDKLSTSSLVGADDELAIQEWIAGGEVHDL